MALKLCWWVERLTAELAFMVQSFLCRVETAKRRKTEDIRRREICRMFYTCQAVQSVICYYNIFTARTALQHVNRDCNWSVWIPHTFLWNIKQPQLMPMIAWINVIQIGNLQAHLFSGQRSADSELPNSSASINGLYTLAALMLYQMPTTPDNIINKVGHHGFTPPPPSPPYWSEYHRHNILKM